MQFQSRMFHATGLASNLVVMQHVAIECCAVLLFGVMRMEGQVSEVKFQINSKWVEMRETSLCLAVYT